MGRAGRHRESRLDPYMDKIREMLDAGSTYGEIADEMSKYFDDWVLSSNTICTYAISRGLRSKVTQGARDGRIYIPHCDNCSSCKLVLNTAGSRSVRVCMVAMRAVSRSCLTSPMWCEERKEVC